MEQSGGKAYFYTMRSELNRAGSKQLIFSDVLLHINKNSVYRIKYPAVCMRCNDRCRYCVGNYFRM